MFYLCSFHRLFPRVGPWPISVFMYIHIYSFLYMQVMCIHVYIYVYIYMYVCTMYILVHACDTGTDSKDPESLNGGNLPANFQLVHIWDTITFKRGALKSVAQFSGPALGELLINEFVTGKSSALKVPCLLQHLGLWFCFAFVQPCSNGVPACSSILQPSTL